MNIINNRLDEPFKIDDTTEQELIKFFQQIPTQYKYKNVVFYLFEIFIKMGTFYPEDKKNRMSGIYEGLFRILQNNECIDNTKFMKILKMFRDNRFSIDLCSNIIFEKLSKVDDFINFLDDENNMNMLNGISDLLFCIIDSGRLEKASSEEQINFYRVLNCIYGPKTEKYLIEAFKKENNYMVKALLARFIEKHFNNTKLLLETLYPDKKEQITELLTLFPNLKNMECDGFCISPLAQKNGIENLISQLKHTLMVLGQNEYEKIIQDWRNPSDITVIIPLEKRSIFNGYSLHEHVVNEMMLSQYPYIEIYNNLNVKDFFRNICLKAILRKKYKVYKDRLIDSNFKALELMNKNMTKENGKKIIKHIKIMLKAFKELSNEEKYDKINIAFNRIVKDLESLSEWNNLSDNEELSQKLRQKITLLENPEKIQTLHAVILYLHKEGTKALMKNLNNSAQNITASFGRIKANVSNLGYNELFEGTRITSRPFKIILKTFQNMPFQGRIKTNFVVIDNFMSYSVKLAKHTVEVAADLNSPDEGGFIKIKFFESGYEDYNKFRADYISLVLKTTGFDCKISKYGNQYLLDAVLDKDHGAVNASQLEESLVLALRVFYFSLNMDLGFGSIYEKVQKHFINEFLNNNILLNNQNEEIISENIRKKMQEIIQDMAYFFLSEGYRAFSMRNKFSVMYEDYVIYKKKIKDNYEIIYEQLNNWLINWGLPLMPQGIIGQRVIDQYFNKPIAEALAREELILNSENKIVKNEQYNPIEKVLIRINEDDSELIQTAMTINTLPEDIFDFKTIGFVGALKAVTGQVELSGGTNLIIEGFRSVDTNQMIYAAASIKEVNQRLKNITLEYLAEILNNEGYSLTKAELPTEPQKAQAKSMLNSVYQTKEYGAKAIKGISLSQGNQDKYVCGRVTFNKKYFISDRDKENRILIVPFTTPDDLTSIQSANAVITTGGGMLSHASITTREYGIPSIMLSDAVWDNNKENNGLFIKYEESSMEQEDLEKSYKSKGVITGQRMLREGDIIQIKAKDGKVFVFSEESQELLKEVYSYLEADNIDEINVFLKKLYEEFANQKISEEIFYEVIEFVIAQSMQNEILREKVKEIILELQNEIVNPHKTRVEDIAKEIEAAVRKVVKRLTKDNSQNEAVKKQKIETENKTEVVYKLEEVNASCVEIAGGKAANLGEILSVVNKEGGTVPKGLVLTTNAFMLFLKQNGIYKKFDSLTKELDTKLKDTLNDSQQQSNIIKEYSQKIRNLIKSVNFKAKDMEEGLGEIFIKALDENNMGEKLAVRSSAVQEDTKEAASAGAADSFLNVNREKFLEKVQECWMSFWTERSIEYRAKNGILENEVKPAVLVQEMVTPDAAGVIFTINPVNNKDEVVINASYGLGEAVVSGAVNCDKYVSRKSDGLEIEFPIIGNKRIKIVGKKKGSGTKKVSVSEKDRKCPCLNQE